MDLEFDEEVLVEANVVPWPVRTWTWTTVGISTTTLNSSAVTALLIW